MTSNTLSPFAAQLTRLAAFVSDNDLPDAGITVHTDGKIVIFDFATCEHPENAFRRYAQALEFPVHVQPYEDKDGCVAELLSANGTRDGVFYICQIVRPVLAVVSA